MSISHNSLLLFSVVILLGLLALLFFEKRSLRKALEQFQWRIQVNGTRGKSSVTEYIIAGLQGSSYRAAGKITGIVPTFIDTALRKIPIRRWGSARIQEQCRIIRRAARMNCNTLVLECMSIDPELQTTESRFLRPRISVLTNIREDHFESMGANLKKQALAMIDSIAPTVEHIISPSGTFDSEIALRAAKIGATRIQPREYVSMQELQNLPGAFAENINLAIAVCDIMGISPVEARQQILNYLNAQPKSTIFNVPVQDNCQIRFINAFAVNDIPSLEEFLSKYMIPDIPAVALVNTRSDRPLRTVKFAEWLGRKSIFERIIVTGDHRAKLIRMLESKAVPAELILDWNGRNISSLFTLATKGYENEIQLVGLANIAGPALRLVENLVEEGLAVC